MGDSRTDQTERMSVAIQSNLEIAGLSLQLLTCKINGNLGNSAGLGFIESSEMMTGLPKHVCVARSIS